MKLIKLSFLTLLIFSVFSCSSDQVSDSELAPTAARTTGSIIIPQEETIEFDDTFEREMGVHNLNIDVERDSYIDSDRNLIYVPILPGYVIDENTTTSSNVYELTGPGIEEVSGEIKFTIARLNPRKDPSKCQGGCKCGIGLRCGNEKSIGVKISTDSYFDENTREAIASQFIDTRNNYYIFGFITKGIDWEKLNNE